MIIDKQFKIKLICIYYGMLPEWFPLWLKSCSKNPNYDFLLITDQKYENTYAKNVEIKNLSWEELKHKFENVLEMPISLEKPYKLCDFRPIFGMAFADELKEYDFWGHCDLDMIQKKTCRYMIELAFMVHLLYIEILMKIENCIKNMVHRFHIKGYFQIQKAIYLTKCQE